MGTIGDINSLNYNNNNFRTKSKYRQNQYVEKIKYHSNKIKELQQYVKDGINLPEKHQKQLVEHISQVKQLQNEIKDENRILKQINKDEQKKKQNDEEIIKHKIKRDIDLTIAENISKIKQLEDDKHTANAMNIREIELKQAEIKKDTAELINSSTSLQREFQREQNQFNKEILETKNTYNKENRDTIHKNQLDIMNIGKYKDLEDTQIYLRTLVNKNKNNMPMTIKEKIDFSRFNRILDKNSNLEMTDEERKFKSLQEFKNSDNPKQYLKFKKIDGNIKDGIKLW